MTDKGIDTHCAHKKRKKEYPPIFFILSRPRSGSTLLRTLLDAHPQINFPLECQFIVNLYPRFGNITQWTDKSINAFVDQLGSQHFFYTWNIDLKTLRTDLLHEPRPNTYTDLCRQVYLHYKSMYPKENITYIGDKNPGYALYVDFLAELFPDAKFIHLTRDHRDNHISLINAGFEMPIISMTCAKWRHFFDKIDASACKHPDRFMKIRYEDIVENLDQSLNEICEFLNIPWNQSMTSFYREKKQFEKQYGDYDLFKLHSGLMQPVHQSRTGIWKTWLTPEQIMRADFVAGKSADTAGYTRVNKNPSIFLKLSTIPGVVLANFTFFAIFLADFLPYRARSFILQKLTEKIENLWRCIFQSCKSVKNSKQGKND